MANIQAQKKWSEIRLLESHELARGGITGNMNEQAIALAERTEFLNQEKASKSEIAQGVFEFGTYAEFNSAKAILPLNCTVVIGEENKTGSGQWGIGNNRWNGTSLTKSPYDPFTQAKADATEKAEAAKNDAITAAATDASTKAATAESNAKQNVDNRDTRLVLALYQTLITLESFRTDFDSYVSENNLAVGALSTKTDSNSNASTDRDARLLLGLQQSLSALSVFRDDFDSYVSENNLAVGALSTKTDSNSNASTDRDARLLLGLQQLSRTVDDFNYEYDLKIKTIDSGVDSKIQVITANNENLITRLHLGLQNIVQTLGTVYSDLNFYYDYFNEDAKTQRNLLFHQIAIQLSRLDGFDPDNAGGGGASIEAEKVIIFDTPDQIIRIDVSTLSQLPTAKGTVLNADIALNVGGSICQAYGTLEVQGSSSASMPKKNWTFGFFSDENRTQEVSIKLGHLLPQQELVWKANFVDNTQSRNIACNRLWQQMVESRIGFPKNEVDLVNMINPDLTAESYSGFNYQPTGAVGHVDGFPAVVYINNAFYGIGTLNIGKKRDSYNLKKDSQKHIQLEPLGGVDYFDMTIEEFEIRRPATWGNDANASFERFRSFLQMSQADMVTAGIDNYLNRKNMMDFIILMQVCHLWDHLYKNTLYTTWDGLIWSFMPYDLDTIWGLKADGHYFAEDGSQYIPPTSLFIPNSVNNSNTGTIAKFRKIYGADLDARYAALRKAKIIDVDNIVNLCEEITRKFPLQLLDAENKKWNTGSTSIYTSLQQTGSLYQINKWLSIHIPVCDTYFNYTATA